MNTSQMKNIIVLKDLPSNMIDEAIVILKSNCKAKEIAENKNTSNTEEMNNNSDLVLKEAELIIQGYIEDIERPKEIKKQLKSMTIKYKKLKVCSFFLGVSAILTALICIIK